MVRLDRFDRCVDQVSARSWRPRWCRGPPMAPCEGNDASRVGVGPTGRARPARAPAPVSVRRQRPPEWRPRTVDVPVELDDQHCPLPASRDRALRAALRTSGVRPGALGRDGERLAKFVGDNRRSDALTIRCWQRSRSGCGCDSPGTWGQGSVGRGARPDRPAPPRLARRDRGDRSADQFSPAAISVRALQTVGATPAGSSCPVESS
jgi:hypothetical protein